MTPTPKDISDSRKNLGKILILGLYILQGIRKGFMVYTIPLLLNEKGANFHNLGTYSLSRYPFAFMIFYGFFIDMFYIKRYGKILTYVIGFGYTFGFWMIYVAYYLEQQINDLSINLITFEIFLFMIVLALLDLSA